MPAEGTHSHTLWKAERAEPGRRAHASQREVFRPRIVFQDLLRHLQFGTVGYHNALIRDDVPAEKELALHIMFSRSF